MSVQKPTKILHLSPLMATPPGVLHFRPAKGCLSLGYVTCALLRIDLLFESGHPPRHIQDSRHTSAPSRCDERRNRQPGSTDRLAKSAAGTKPQRGPERRTYQQVTAVKVDQMPCVKFDSFLERRGLDH